MNDIVQSQGRLAPAAGALERVLHCDPSYDNRIRWKPGQRLHHLFEAKCDATPEEQLALIADDATYTFRELDARANQTARRLLALGLKADDRVAVLFDRSSHGFVALLALLKIGAAYIPLDCAFPDERIAFILADGEASAVLSVSALEEKVADFPLKKIFVDAETTEIDALPTARLDEAEAPAPTDTLFYIIYTSGTTGKPKGVAIDHAGICNFVLVQGEVYGMRDGDRCYQGMSLAFDFHVESLWGPLIAGATIVSPPQGASLFGADLHAFLAERQVTILPCVPTLWATLEEDLPEVRIIMLSGEAVPHYLVERWHREDRLILNCYGPTECSVSSTIRRLLAENQVTIGKPLPSYMVVILKEGAPEVVAPGEIGEIGIAGVSLARGYVNREELTAQKFISDFLDLPDNPSGRIYRTGDLGRVREDGELEFHGRIDTQIKIRGYRVELGEIEAMLQDCAGVHQAIVNPVEIEEGAPELAGFYTRDSSGAAPSIDEMVAALKDRLPSYMRPSYLEELDEIPMTSNTKADRRRLPKPSGPRIAISSKEAVAPRNDLERDIAEALSGALNVQNPSVTDDFFKDLGAHSLLMARFGAALRKKLGVSVSMRDVYLNPTVEKLGEHLAPLLAAGASNDNTGPSPRETFHHVSRAQYLLCGALMGGYMFAWTAFSFYIGVELLIWTYAAMPDMGAAYLRLLGSTVGLIVVFSALPIAAKWLFVGAWKEEVIPVWSLKHFKFWAIKGLIRSAPIAFFGAPYYNWYLRRLGAKIGKGAVLIPRAMPVCTDMLSIGANTIIRKETWMNMYKAEGNRIYTGRIEIGDNAFVGEGAVLDINVKMGNDTQLGHDSSLQEGETVADGRHVHGVPVVETTADYCPIVDKPVSSFRRFAYYTRLVALGLLITPFFIVMLYASFATESSQSALQSLMLTADWETAALALGGLVIGSLPSFLMWLAIGLVLLRAIPWALNQCLEPDKVYPKYGLRYFAHTAITAISNSQFYNNMFGDATYTPFFMQWVGWKLNNIVQTGSNFGSDQRHENPFLTDIGAGTMVSGGLKIINETVSASSFKTSKVMVGENTYLGNYIRIPSDAKIGENVLIGTKALLPIDGPIRENTGLLGAPAFEIPRAASRDLQLGKMDPDLMERQIARKMRYNAITSLLFTLNYWVLLVIGLCTGFAGLMGFPALGWWSFFVAGVVGFAVMVAWMWFAERLSLNFGRLRPRLVRVLDDHYWGHERHKAVSVLHLLEGLTIGTPFKSLVARLQGVRYGKQVFDDGFQFNEYTLNTVGDHCNLNAGGLIQPHTLEEGVFKSDYVVVGDHVTLGVGCNLHYGVTVGDYASVQPNSFVMKGESIEAEATWGGNPAQAVAPRKTALASVDATRTPMTDVAVLLDRSATGGAAPSIGSAVAAARTATSRAQILLREAGDPPRVEGLEDAYAFHQRLPGYRETPLVSSPELARRLGVGEVLIKDETTRFDLPSFKILGASWAAYAAMAERIGPAPAGELTEEVLRDWAAPLRPLTLVAATDGNHGRAVARVARWFGLDARIFVPRFIDAARAQAIADEGAEVVTIDGVYDASVDAAAEDGAKPGRLLISDTARSADEITPRQVMAGYTTAFQEVETQLERMLDDRIDALAIQAGVGGLAGAGVLWARQLRRCTASAPKVAVVEPSTAACVAAALAANRPVTLPADEDTEMAVLQCGTVSLSAFETLRDGVSASIAVQDDWAAEAVELMAAAAVRTRQSGAAAAAGILSALSGPNAAEIRAHLGLKRRMGRRSRLLLLATEAPMATAEAKSRNESRAAA